MSVLTFLWIIYLLIVVGSEADIYEAHYSDEDFKTIERSDKLLQTDRGEMHRKLDYDKKYRLRFNPSSLRQSSNSPLPNFPSTGYPNLSLEDFDDGNPNAIPAPGIQNSILSNNQPQISPSSPSVASLGNNINTLNNLIPTSISPQNSSPQIIPNSLLNQTNNLLNIPFPAVGPISPGIGLQTLQPGGISISNFRPAGSNSFLTNFPSQPILATLPKPGIGTNMILGRPQTISEMLAVMGNRVKNLFYGLGPTFVKRPEGSRGFLNLFDVIKFQNGPCIGSLNRIRLVNGTCFYKSECHSRGGIVAGICAGGYGVCCVFKYSCGSQTLEEITYLESPNYPLATTEPLTCAFVVHLQPGVRQVRLDLLFFELRRPLAGNCLEDQFVVSGQNKNFFVPIICGINSGQHMYINVDRSLDRKLQLSIVARNPGARAFSIRVTQLRYYLAPSYCLQYYTEPTGYIKSFNYDDIGSVVEDRVATYLNNMNYAICIERVQDKCDVTFTNEVAEGELRFQLININEQGLPLVPPNQAGLDVFSCPGDFIAFNSLRLCGWKLNDASVSQNVFQNAPITEYSAGPVVIPVQTDETVVGRGFKLMYYQEACV